MKKTLTILLLSFLLQNIKAAERFIFFNEKPHEANICLSSEGIIQYDAKEHKGVIIAIDNLKSDLQKVIGHSNVPIIIGTWGESDIVKKCLSKDKATIKLLDKELKGKYEKYIITTIQNGTEDCLLIVGSDKRGTIYGIYELSEQIGVSPWYWWADVPVQTHKNVYAKSAIYTDGEPAGKYRGIFINDEWPAMGAGANSTFGGFNHKMYEKVFELILRLKGNYMWSAMWNSSFY
nr:glycosyl hydrolase 115 family protein [Bacteroidaceae bacterium]